MEDINRIELQGHVGHDARIVKVGDTTVARFSLATTEIYRDRDGLPGLRQPGTPSLHGRERICRISSPSLKDVPYTWWDFCDRVDIQMSTERRKSSMRCLQEALI